ncbi:hypothetical protein [Moraxella lacunata]|uniref:hypothetical protein n=1 Tax=Moraxella lacunata TaxID=477 RepID=UPI003EE1CE28
MAVLFLSISFRACYAFNICITILQINTLNKPQNHHTPPCSKTTHLNHQYGRVRNTHPTILSMSFLFLLSVNLSSKG